MVRLIGHFINLAASHKKILISFHPFGVSNVEMFSFVSRMIAFTRRNQLELIFVLRACDVTLFWS